MIDTNIWHSMSDEEKLEELETLLTSYRKLDSNNHELKGTPEAGKIRGLKKELKEKILKIIELEQQTK
jgi:hypothetical protein